MSKISEKLIKLSNIDNMGKKEKKIDKIPKIRKYFLKIFPKYTGKNFAKDYRNREIARNCQNPQN
jgi:hypothetical protein